MGINKAVNEKSFGVDDMEHETWVIWHILCMSEERKGREGSSWMVSLLDKRNSTLTPMEVMCAWVLKEGSKILIVGRGDG